MTNQPDLFTYPFAAGYTERSTSKDAADQIEKSGRAKSLREKVLAFFDAGHEGTSEVVAEIMGEPFQAIQPRISELRKQGKVIPSGRRERMDRGGMGHVWKRA
jgi:hypothetical protein